MARNLTQEALAEAAQVDRRTLSLSENGHRPINIDQLFLVARRLGVPPAWLLSDDELPTAAE
jgi:transcriptional regulator with XRE-family HTH domain